MKLVYPAILTPYDDETGFVVEVPDLPGCVSGGASLIEAIEMGVDAASGWILDEIEDGKLYPPASDPSKLDVPENSFVSLLVLDMTSYAEKYGRRAVRKNITIPAWLDTFAQKNQISLSKVVQDGLLAMAQAEKKE
ncbi:MAG: type II toxin-antitoxin system HicB family antitoxin [Firmicutes bacterium]|nr:type II toxin-antitoxin system HicB family antitoxin [Bacillota bacterium]